MIDSFIDSLIKKIRDNFRVYLERAHLAFLTTLVVLVINKLHWLSSWLFYLFLLHGSCYDVRYSSKRWHQYFYRKQKWCFVNHSIHFHLRPHRLLSCHGNPMTFCLVALWCMNRWSAMNSTKRYFHRILKGQIKSIYFKLTFIL